MLPQVENDYIETGKIKYFFLDFPLESIHKKALKAHEAANCAGEQEKFWEMHDLIFANSRKLDLVNFTQHADALGLNPPAFQECINSGKYVAKIRKDISEGKKAGVRATPSFLFGFMEKNGTQVRAVKRKRGVSNYNNFKREIDRMLVLRKKN